MFSARLEFYDDVSLGTGNIETDGLVLGPQLAVSQDESTVRMTCCESKPSLNVWGL